jgi:hypothetical protein
MTEGLVSQFILYYGPAIVFVVVLVWAVLHIGNKLENMATLQRETNSSNLKMIELLGDIRATINDQAK